MAGFLVYSGFIAVFLSVFYIANGLYTSNFYLSKVAQQMPKDTQLHHRSERKGDPSFFVPHLFQGDIIFIEICTNDWLNISFTNITYSNDGESDRITVSLDGLYLGHFETLSHTNWGLFWEEFHGSQYIGRSGNLPPGQHTIAIQVELSGDCYGVELGTVYIETNTQITDKRFWCGHSYKLAPVRSECIPGELVPNMASTAPSTTLPQDHIEVRQYSYKSDCLDMKNVRIGFKSRDLAGTTITASQDVSSAPMSLKDRNKSSSGRFCKNGIWQLGNIDGDNNEFQSIYPGESISINLTGTANHDSMFPAKILPFVTREIIINFPLPEVMQIKGSAFFALGLVNLTKRVDVGLQYFDHNRGVFSDIHFISFTPTWLVMGWNIPDVGKILGTNNTFKLHFISESNVIMFDFLKLEYNQLDERKENILLSQGERWKIRALRFNSSNGADVIIDTVKLAANIDELVVLCKIEPFRHYQNVLRIHSDGQMYMYKPYYVNHAEQEKILVDVSSFLVAKASKTNIKFANSVSAIYLNTSSDAITIHYGDGSVLHLKLTANISHTTLQITSFQTERDQRSPSSEQTLFFMSTHVTDYLAAINEITIDGRTSRGVMENMNDYSGGYKYILRKTTPTSMYYANNKIEINFPN